jgi:hypothetical protein
MDQYLLETLTFITRLRGQKSRAARRTKVIVAISLGISLALAVIVMLGAVIAKSR